jgi:hypothetical protein
MIHYGQDITADCGMTATIPCLRRNDEPGDSQSSSSSAVSASSSLVLVLVLVLGCFPLLLLSSSFSSSSSAVSASLVLVLVLVLVLGCFRFFSRPRLFPFLLLLLSSSSSAVSFSYPAIHLVINRSNIG